jgi:hypothetical protein
MWFLLKLGGLKDKLGIEVEVNQLYTPLPIHSMEKKTCITTFIIRIKQNWSKNRGIPQQIMISGAVPPARHQGTTMPGHPSSISR